jgi:hypothetical protein
VLRWYHVKIVSNMYPVVSFKGTAGSGVPHLHPLYLIVTDIAAVRSTQFRPIHIYFVEVALFPGGIRVEQQR